jgi:DNA-binding NtrC family response regulator
MKSPLNVLLVEDSEDDALFVVRELQRGHFAVRPERVDTEAALTSALDRQSWDVIIADYSMPRFNGLDALHVVRQRGLEVPFIVVSGTMGETLAVEAMRQGARDYLLKGNIRRLCSIVDRELRENQKRRLRPGPESETLELVEWLEEQVRRRTLDLETARAQLDALCQCVSHDLCRCAPSRASPRSPSRNRAGRPTPGSSNAFKRSPRA